MMKKRWEALRVDHDFSTIPTEEYKLILEEFAEMIYRDFCQLQKDEPLEHNLNAVQAAERMCANG
jgi:hypothetical protein